MKFLFRGQLIIFFFFFLGKNGREVVGQNLVPNPNFSEYTFCPTGWLNGGALPCPPWQNGNTGTINYYNVCAAYTSVWVPDNDQAYQWPYAGIAYLDMFTGAPNFPGREYAQVQLTSPLVAGSTYYVSFYVNLADIWCGSMPMGAYLSHEPPPYTIAYNIPVIPQIESTYIITDTANWVIIDGCYLAQGGEDWITIGNFRAEAETSWDPNCTTPHGFPASVYFLSYVSVEEAEPGEEIVFDLGDPVTACHEHEIDPGITGVNYLWSNGSTGPTLTVYETGMYALTISNYCDRGIDSVYVEIVGTLDVVEIGEDSLELCPGETFEISLDPQWAYEWQDGSTDSDYTIAEEGIYQVTMDDGCATSSDEIVVSVLQSPSPFSLGVDAFLCPGDEIVYDFSPDLGEFLWQDNNTSSYYLIQEGGEYALTISNECGEAADEIIITDLNPPSVDLGPNQYVLCQGDQLAYNLDPDMGEYSWTDQSTSPDYIITSAGNYGVTVSNSCGNAADSVAVTEIAPVVFEFGDDITVCPSQLPYTLDASGALNATSYLWQDGSASAQFLADEEGMYTVTVSNTCFSEIESVFIIVDDVAPVVELPPDTLICPGDSLILNNVGDNGDYLWQDNTTEESFIVTSPGTYKLTITNSCGSGMDSVLVNFVSPIPVPNLGPDFSLCPGEQFVLTPNIPGVHYFWQDASTNDSLLVTDAGTYFVIIQDQCTVASDTIIISINNSPPQVDLPDQFLLCQDSSITVTPAINGVSFSWNDGSQLPSLSISNPGQYSLTVSNACGMDSDTIHVIDAGTVPFVSLGNDLQLCEGDTIFLLPESMNVEAWLWNDGTTSNEYLVTEAGTITLQVTNACGVSSDTLIASFLPAIPLFSLGGDTSMCPGNSVLLSIPIAGVEILWSDGSHDNQLEVFDPGQYAVSISNACGENADTVNVVLLPAVPSLNLGPDQSLCPGENFIIDPGITGVQYLWQDGSTDPSFSINQPQLVTLIISNSCGSQLDSLEIFESTEGPDIDLGPDIQACIGETITVEAGVLGVDYLWQDGSSASYISTNVSDTLLLQVMNACGYDADTLYVDFLNVPGDFDFGSDTVLCTGQTLLLTAPAATGMLEWQDGSTSPHYVVDHGGNYSLILSNECGSASDSISVSYLSKPLPFDLGADTTICKGDVLNLLAPQTTDELEWQDGSHSPGFTVSQSGIYSLSIINKCGTESDAIEVIVEDHQPAFGEDVFVLCPGDEILLNAAQNFSANYHWNTGAVLPAILISETGIYVVTITTFCKEASHQFEIMPAEDCGKTEIFIPNVFTPNFDKINDVWTLQTSSGLQMKSLEVTIFDRWGNVVFASAEPTFIWDGTFAGQEVQSGVYVFKMNLVYVLNGKEVELQKSGDITVIR